MDHHNKLKSKWESNNLLMFDKGDYGYDGISWRQRNFMCNFCKKEYKSAQALGGHMNVHRRDRARLRLSSPSHLDHHQNPNNPNPNIFSSPPPSNSSHLLCLPYNTTNFHSSLFPLSSPPLSVLHNQEQQEMFPFVPHSARNFLGDHVMRKNMNMEASHVANFNGSFNYGDCVDQEKESRVWNRKMEMDLLKDGKIETGLDLELRLGRP